MTNAKNFSQLTSVCKRIVFFGSSEFSLPALEFLLSLPAELTVVTAPDQPKGRGLRVQSNPVKVHCQTKAIPSLAPPSLRDPEIEKQIAALCPDVFVVASYGKLIPDSWLKLPRKAAFNVHPSLLPKYRGAAPITWQIVDGAKETGVSIAEVTKDLDAGDLFSQIRVPLDLRETLASLTYKLSRLSVKALEEVFLQLIEGKLKRTPQNHADFSYARKLTKEDSVLNLNEPGWRLDQKIRAFDSWPGAFTPYQGTLLRILEAEPEDLKTKNPVGTLLTVDLKRGLQIQTGEGVLWLQKVQLPGRRVVLGSDFANGERLKPGFIFK